VVSDRRSAHGLESHGDVRRLGYLGADSFAIRHSVRRKSSIKRPVGGSCCFASSHCPEIKSPIVPKINLVRCSS